MIKIKNKIINSMLFLVLVAFVTIVGCKNDDGISPNMTGADNVSVGYFAPSKSTDNTIIITEAKLLLRKLDIELAESEDASEIKLGPFVVYLDMNAKVVLAGVTKIEAGNYDEIHFQIHKPSPQENISDPDFTESTSKRFSVVVKGIFNGVSFVYKSPITVAKEIEFENQPISIGAVPPVVNITIVVDPYSWFDKNGVIMDPTDENNWNDIDHNIKESLKRAFRDMDLNGEPD